MSEDCIFCAIVEGEIPSHTVYEDPDLLAFMDANPLAEGHVLVIPKEHHETLADLPSAIGGEIGEVVTDLAPAVEDAVGAEATTVAFNNGTAAGQEVPHVHCHVVPRTQSDGAGPIHALFDHRPTVDDDELAETAAKIRED